MRVKFLILLYCLTLPAILQSGCSRVFKSSGNVYRTVTGELGVNTDIAKRKNEQAIACLQSGNLRQAQQLAHEALAADPSFGPAHNTLGKIYFQQNKYYLAAWEFEYANHAMPERIEPLNNLGLVYERAGRYDQAIVFYEQAHFQSPDTAEILGNLIRAKLARGDTPYSMQEQIHHLILIDDRPEWVNWARLKLLSDDTETKLLREIQDRNFAAGNVEQLYPGTPFDSQHGVFEEVYPELAPPPSSTPQQNLDPLRVPIDR